MATKKTTTKKKTTAKRGRPTLYSPQYTALAKNLAEIGLIDVQIAKALGIQESTLYEWKKKHKDFAEAIKAGKKQSDEAVVNALFQRAVGYSHFEDKINVVNNEVVTTPVIKQYPPDTQACRLWLTNRRPEEWREKQDIEMTGKDGGPIQTEEVGETEAARRVAFALLKHMKEKGNA